ncbi:MAG: hypothetical protein NT164_02030 [Verrucomicrobiae bacterium]|nr:hypothetical protein [Verrucomicrobiae bacterium]
MAAISSTFKSGDYTLPAFYPQQKSAAANDESSSGLNLSVSEGNAESLAQGDIRVSRNSSSPIPRSTKYIIRSSDSLNFTTVPVAVAQDNQKTKTSFFWRALQSIRSWMFSNDAKLQEAVTQYLEKPDDLNKNDLISVFKTHSARVRRPAVITAACGETFIRGVTHGLGVLLLAPIATTTVNGTPWASIVSPDDLIMYNEVRPYMKHDFSNKAVSQLDDYSILKEEKKQEFASNLTMAALLDIDVTKVSEKELQAIEGEAEQFAAIATDFFSDGQIPQEDKAKVKKILLGTNKRASWDVDQVMHSIQQAYSKKAMDVYSEKFLAFYKGQNTAMQTTTKDSLRALVTNYLAKSLPYELGDSKQQQADNQQLAESTVKKIFAPTFRQSALAYKKSWQGLNPLGASPLEQALKEMKDSAKQASGAAV